MSSGFGSHHTPVAVLDLVMDLKLGPISIGPILEKGDWKREFEDGGGGS